MIAQMRLNGVEGVVVLRDVLLHKTLDILDLIHLGGLPVMRAVDERVLGMADLDVQIVERDMESCLPQHSNRRGELVFAREELDAGDAIHIYLVIHLNVIRLRIRCEDTEEQRDQYKNHFLHHDNTILNTTAKIIFFTNAWYIQKNYIFAARN